MKAFEKDIKKRMQLSTMVAVLGGLVIIAYFVIQLGLDESVRLLNVSPSVMVGFLCGVEFTAIYRILSYKKALASPEELEALHIREHDERNRMIAWKTCRSCIFIALVLLGLAGIIASFINTVVFWTIGAVIIGILIVYCLTLLYYRKKL